MYAVGTVLAGKYRVDRILGQGGMGVVMGATHLQLGIPVALKVLHRDVAEGNHMERFLREARAAAGLKSENVCRVTDVAVMEDGTPYIVMENLVGCDLKELVHTEGPLPVATACECVMQACVALAEAHAHGIVHRDLKPANLFSTQRPDGSRLIKVLDFGVAKAPASLQSLTQTTTMVGSPGYMSPEQLKSSKDVDVRADVWALGVVLYELITGKLPFIAETLAELVLRIARDPTPQITGVGPVAAIIQTCLQKDPAQRYQNVAQLAAELAPFAGKRGPDLAATISGVLAGISGSPIPHTARDSSTAVVAQRHDPESARSNPARIGLIIGVATLVVASVIVLVVGLSSSNDDPPAAAAGPESTPVATPTPTEPPAPTPTPAEPPPPTPAEQVAQPVAVPADAAAEEQVQQPVEEVATETPTPTPTTKTATTKTGGTKTTKVGTKTTTKTGTKTGTKTTTTTKTTKPTIEEVSESRR